jgi:hypothetical protein
LQAYRKIISSSVVDPDPARSETFCTVRIRKDHFESGQLWLKNNFSTKVFNLKYKLLLIKNVSKNLLSRHTVPVICNLTHVQDGNTKVNVCFFVC